MLFRYKKRYYSNKNMKTRKWKHKLPATDVFFCYLLPVCLPAQTLPKANIYEERELINGYQTTCPMVHLFLPASATCVCLPPPHSQDPLPAKHSNPIHTLTDAEQDQMTLRSRWPTSYVEEGGANDNRRGGVQLTRWGVGQWSQLFCFTPWWSWVGIQIQCWRMS